MFRNHKTNVIAKNNISHYSYVLDHDTGYAPNPFWGYMTLATCKPRISSKRNVSVRKNAQKGSWVIGTGGSKLYLERFEYYNGKLKEISPEKNMNNKRLVFAFKVGEVVDTFEKYFNDPRFECKKIPRKENEAVRCQGDNHLFDRRKEGSIIYYSSDTNDNDKIPVKVERVLVSKENDFYYFGCFAPVLNPDLWDIIHKCQGETPFYHDKAEQLEAFLVNVTGGKKGIFGFPSFKNEKRYREKANDVLLLYLKAIYNEYLKGVISDKELKKLIECKEIRNSSLRKIFEG